jgi:hypothetical protein
VTFGDAKGAALTITPSTVDFTAYLVGCGATTGITGGITFFTVANTGNVATATALTTQVSTAGWSASVSCDYPLPAGGMCNVTLYNNATAPGVFSTKLTISDSAESVSANALVTVVDMRSCPDAGVPKPDGSSITTDTRTDALTAPTDGPLSFPDSATLRGDGPLHVDGGVALGTLVMTQLTAGSAFECGIQTDGTVKCWGYAAYNTPITSPAGTFTQVSAGGSHACGLKADGTTACWGNNSSGQSTPPADVFTQIAAGGSHTCGLTSGGTVVCWGYNNSGQSTPPADVFTQITAGAVHSCGLKSNGTIVCWGSGNDGQRFPPIGSFTQVVAGAYHTCGLKTDGTIACWGSNSDGQSTPPSGSFTKCGAGPSAWHTCAVNTLGAVVCWGYNEYGQTNPPIGNFTQVVASQYNTCALGSDGLVKCWGDHYFGESSPP